MEPYASRFPDVDERLPQTNALARTVLVLPAGAAVDAGQASQICEILRVATDGSSAVRDRLAERDFQS
jgi:dTDP-4-amino-4,6-dideoxygalactose transaminase